MWWRSSEFLNIKLSHLENTWNVSVQLTTLRFDRWIDYCVLTITAMLWTSGFFMLAQCGQRLNVFLAAICRQSFNPKKGTRIKRVQQINKFVYRLKKGKSQEEGATGWIWIFLDSLYRLFMFSSCHRSIHFTKNDLRSLNAFTHNTTSVNFPFSIVVVQQIVGLCDLPVWCPVWIQILRDPGDAIALFPSHVRYPGEVPRLSVCLHVSSTRGRLQIQTQAKSSLYSSAADPGQSSVSWQQQPEGNQTVLQSHN